MRLVMIMAFMICLALASACTNQGKVRLATLARQTCEAVDPWHDWRPCDNAEDIEYQLKSK